MKEDVWTPMMIESFARRRESIVNIANGYSTCALIQMEDNYK